MSNLTASLKNKDIASKTKDVLSKVVKNRHIYMLGIPGILVFLVFRYYPLYFLQAAFKDYDPFVGLANSPWVWLDNFKRLFNSHYFGQVFRNTLILSMMYRFLAFPVPIIFALLLNEVRRSFIKRSLQTFVYIPHFISWVVVGGIFATILSPSTGIVNVVLKSFGAKPKFFMADPHYFRWILLFSYIWKESGWKTIIYLASMSTIPPELYEAAIVDGAGRFKQALHITLPGISIAIVVVFVLSMSRILSLFEQVLIMYNPIVASVSETIDTYGYKLGIKDGQISFAVALGIFKNVFALSLMLITNRLADKIRGERVF